MKSRIICFWLLLGCCTSSFSQRVCDLEAHILLPDSGTVFDSPSNVDIDLMIINRGPDMLKASDFIAHGLKIGGASYGLNFYEVIDNYEVNDTIFVTQNVRLLWTVDFANLDACINRCFAYTPSNGTDTVFREREGNPLYANNNDCVKVDMKYTTASVDLPTLESEYIIYPNPTSGTIHFSHDYVYGSFVVTDMRGVSLLSGTVSDTNAIDASSLSSGLYIISLISKEGNSVRSKFRKY